LVPFLNSFYPSTAHPGSNGSSTEDLVFSAHSYDERGLYRSQTGRRSHNVLRKGSPVSAMHNLLSTSTPTSSMSPPVVMPAQNRASAPSSISQFARTLSHSARHGFSPSSSPQSPPRPLSTISARPIAQTATSDPASANNPLSPAAPIDTPMGNSPEDKTPPPLPVLVDDVASPSGATDPMTPPTTPPTCDNVLEPSQSPVSAHGWGSSRGNPWKRMRYSFGWRRKPELDALHSQHGGEHSS